MSRPVIMGPRNEVPATHSASQTRVNALLLSRVPLAGTTGRNDERGDGRDRSALAFRELERTPGFGPAVFFALDHARIAGEKAAAL
jgi:hypothetical protein